MCFVEDRDKYWILIRLNDQKQPLNRNYFQGESAGAKLLHKFHITKLEEISYKKVDEWISKCGKIDIEGVDAASKTYLQERRSKDKFAEVAEQIHTNRPAEEIKESDPILKKLKVEFLASLDAGIVASAEIFAKAYKIKGLVTEYATIVEHLQTFQKMEKNHRFIS